MSPWDLSPNRKRGLTLAVASGLCAFLVLELALSARQQSQTWNEADHLLAGLRYWQSRDFGINPEHPPLSKLLASAPLLLFPLRVPVLPRGTGKLESNVAGRKFLYSNDADALLWRARLVAGLLTLFLALLIFEASYQMFGPGPAILSLLLAVFEPNILAHGALVTTDLGLACCLFAAVYAFYRYLKQPSALRLLEWGFISGLALAAKHSGILVFPILGSLALVELFGPVHFPTGLDQPAKERVRRLERQALSLAASLLLVSGIALAVLWAFYGFRFQARPGNEKMTPPLAEYVRGIKSPAESRLILRLASSRVFPESYLYGLADVLIVSAGPRPMFLFGKLYPHGRWFYFPAVFLVKSTLGFLLLLFLVLGRNPLGCSSTRKEILFITIPPALFFAVSLTSGLDIGVRHILPIYPFLLVMVGRGAWNLAVKHRVWAVVVIVLTASHVISSVRSFPHYLAYSNEVWGGPAKTYRVLTDSNVDWGQGLLTAREYLEQHRTTDCWLAFFGSADPSYYHLPCKLLPDPFLGWWGKPSDVVPRTYKGTVLISATEMSGAYWGPGELNPYEQFMNISPTRHLGGSILAFEGNFNLTLACAWSHVNKAWELEAQNHLDQAIAEARQAAALAPRQVGAHFALGYMLARAKRTNEARQEYQTALSLAQTIHPEFQWFWVQDIRNELAQQGPKAVMSK
jgi:hypothetical protein